MSFRCLDCGTPMPSQTIVLGREIVCGKCPAKYMPTEIVDGNGSRVVVRRSLATSKPQVPQDAKSTSAKRPQTQGSNNKRSGRGRVIMAALACAAVLLLTMAYKPDHLTVTDQQGQLSSLTVDRNTLLVAVDANCPFCWELLEKQRDSTKERKLAGTRLVGLMSGSVVRTPTELDESFIEQWPGEIVYFASEHTETKPDAVPEIYSIFWNRFR